MSIATDLFCKMFENWPAEGLDDMLMHCCIAIGETPRSTGVPFSPDEKIGDLYAPLSLRGLKTRMNYLVNEERVMEEFLIPGLLRYLRMHLERLADRDEVADHLDFDLDTIQKLENDLKLPVEQRFYPRSDDEVRKFIETLKGVASDRPKRRQAATACLEYVDQYEDKFFSREFWRALAYHRIDEMTKQMGLDDDRIPPFQVK